MKALSENEIGTIQSRLLFESVADNLRKAILRGDFVPGERLNEVAIAKALNLSRGPVREALRHLEKEGIVTLYPQRGGRVAEVSNRDVVAALAIRELLETMSAVQTCEVIEDKDIQHLEDLIASMRDAERANDIATLVDLDFQFHRDLLNIASSDTAQRTWTLLSGKLMLYQSIGNMNYMKDSPVSDSHTPIIEALRKRDAQEFKSVMLAHIDENRSSIGSLG
ncbi:GntR family transcriptional regulator [Pseudomonas putida]|uniref:GntR family transcriptional regulator n=1 Tax=Pseudomonas putida TaxID=303 RepID=UPI003F39AFD2